MHAVGAVTLHCGATTVKPILRTVTERSCVLALVHLGIGVCQG